MNGDHTDHPQVFEEYRPLLLSLASSILGTDTGTEEMLKQTFRLWQQVPDAASQKARTFLVTTLAALCIERLNLGEPDRAMTTCLAPPQNQGQCCALTSSHISATVAAMLSRLTPTARVIFLLRAVFNCDYCEISRVLGKDEDQCRCIAEQVKREMVRSRTSLGLPLIELSQI